MGALNALRKGWVRSALYWQVLVVLFLVNLLGGLLLAVIPVAELLGPAHYTAIQDAASGVPAWMAIETLLNPVNNLNLEAGTNSRVLSAALQTGVISILLALVLLPVVSWVPGSLVSGGLLLTYFEGSPLSRSPEPAEGPVLSRTEGSALSQSPEPSKGNVEWSALSQSPELAVGKAEWRAGGEAFSWKRFFWGCWHYWGAFLLFGLLQTILTLLVFVPVLAILSFIMFIIPWSAILLLPAFLVLLIVWTGFVELSQVYLVAGEKRRIITALRSGLLLLIRRAAPLTGYYSVSLVLLVVLHLVFRIGLFPRLPLAFWPLVLVVQQAFVFLRMWAHASRLAGDMEFVRSL